ncbi:DUF4174 domain-containing protein [Variovorax sp. PAMC 28711]|uniref:DUF4174 domain-containing protein n=1 Tax=Variovorax sp. PAMC 28711 TaxID=1795631 RepID=UPI00078E7F72|nr:DUF4174 domain-containing protein [Variovorax sp. PAMC 28711]AMM26919.1 hypothetical protein AX767_20370 [Variovorax sp. PAMC 28711]
MNHALLIAAALGLAALPAAADVNPLVAERWKTRPIVVVVPAQDDPLLRRIDAALKQTATREAFIDREMVLYTVAAGDGRRNAVPLRPAQTRALLAALKLDGAGPPTFLLVGKDGGVKMTEGPSVDLAAVFAEIDRMPMRQR